MLKILIVDDEPFFLDFMQDFFQKQTMPCEIVGAVSDGLKAMGVLREKDVDVIFTDIKMPVMDGLELICSAMEWNPEYQFVVLSSYSDFHMVGEAFKLGAKEYALKSEITTEQMEDILAKCAERKKQLELDKQKNQIQKQRFAEMSAQLTSLQNMVDSSRDELKKKYFINLFAKNLTFPEARKERYAETFLPAQTPSSAMVVRLNDCIRILQDTWHNDRFLFEFALNNILGEICQGFPQTVFFCNKVDEFVLFTSSEGGAFELKCKLHDLYTIIQKSLHDSLLMDTIISASDPPESGEDIPVREMYEQALERNTAFFLLGKEHLLASTESHHGGGVFSSQDFIHPLSAQFRQLLTAKNVKELQDHISDYQVKPETVDTSQIEAVRSLFDRYAFYIKEYAVENNDTDRIQESQNYYENYLRSYGTLEEMNTWLEEIVTVLLQQEYHSSSLVKRVKKYVLANYNQDISLTGIASVMEVNPNYLSRAFSREYGDSLISYINLIRVQAAAKLLKESNLKNYEIAERVGYQNVEHFSRIFKKLTGKTPGEYRNEKI